MFKAVNSEAETAVRSPSSLRCLRCNGSTFTDEFEVRHEYARIDFLEDRPRRGRPPKRLAEQRRGIA